MFATHPARKDTDMTQQTSTERAGFVNHIEVEGYLKRPGTGKTTTGKEKFSFIFDVLQGKNPDGSYKPRMTFWCTMWKPRDDADPAPWLEAIAIKDNTRCVVEGRIGMREYTKDDDDKPTQYWEIVASHVSDVS